MKASGNAGVNSAAYDDLLVQMHRRVIRHFCIFYFSLACLAIPPAVYIGDHIASTINVIASLFYGIPLIIVMTTARCYLAARILVIVAVCTLLVNGVASNMDTTLVTISWYFIFIAFAQLVLNTRWSVGVAAIGLGVSVVFTFMHLKGLDQINPGLKPENMILGVPVALFFSFLALQYLLVNYTRISNITLHKLVQSDAEKSYLVRVMSHDLRNSLGAIQGLSFLMEDTLKNGSDAEIKDTCSRNIELIDRTARSALDLVDEVVSSSKDISARLPDIRECSAVDFLHSIVRRYIPTAQQKKIVLSIHAEAENARIYIDADKFSRVIENLLSNAIKFCSAGDEIVVDVRVERNQVLFSVRDTGIGIPDELKDNIFDPFTKSGRKGTADEKSIGLGMSIVKKLVEMHDGIIWIENNLNQGTVVFIQLPVKSSQIT